MKHLNKTIPLLTMIMLACSAPDIQTNGLYSDSIPRDNEMIFDVYAEVSPQGNIPDEDTLWLTIDLAKNLFTDKISEQAVYIPLDEAKFICQFQVTDLIEDTPPSFSMIIESGELVDKTPSLVTVAFGYPNNTTKLKVGFTFSDIGRYSINFINYPNPEVDAQVKNPCTNDCENYWYDLMFYRNNNDDDFEYSAFIEYHFKIADNSNAYDSENFSTSSIYDDAVYTFIVK